MDYLLKHSDEDHPVSTRDIIDYLSENEIRAERKSIYDDLNALERFGFDIVRIGGQNAAYYIGERDLQLVEIKILVDAICSSRFLTKKKTNMLLEKLSKFVPISKTVELKHQVHVMSQVKSDNEQIYYNIDKIHTAMREKKFIHFYYLTYDITRSTHGAIVANKTRRHKNKLYQVYPFGLIWDDQNYYLVAQDFETRETRHYRLDRMEGITLGERGDSQAIEVAYRFDPSNYSNHIFDMYNGEELSITVAFKEELLGVMYDRFGTDIFLEDDAANGMIKTTQTIKVSERFFGWIAAFNGDVKIVHPRKVKENYKEFIQGLLSKLD